jgi:hypothetical protein
VTATTAAAVIGIDRYQVQYIHQMSVGAAFITSVFRIDERCANPERGRDECCPYISISIRASEKYYDVMI